LALISIVSIVISGCAITVNDLKNAQSSFDGSFTSQADATDTYRTLRSMARQCLEYAAHLGSPVIVVSEFDGARKVGEINQKLLVEGLLINNALIEIESHDGDKAKVNLYTTKSILSAGIKTPTISDLRRWADGDENCNAPSYSTLRNWR